MLKKILLVVFGLLAGASLQAAEQQANLGVLAFNGKPAAVKRWQATADYLSQQIPDYSFQLQPLTLEEFEQSIAKESLDFFLTNPGHYVRLEVEEGASRLATFQTRVQGQPLMNFAAVVFTRKGSGITNLKDAKGKRFAAVRENAFGGFQLAQKAFHDVGIDALNELDLLWLGFPHGDIVKAVLEGKADAGVVRAGVLESLAENGDIDLNEIVVLDPHSHDQFPYLHSSDLYPEWPFARLPHTDTDLAKKVALALLTLSEQHEAAVAARGAGWTIPLDYTPVHEVFRSLNLPPYKPQAVTLSDFLALYWHWVVAVLGLIGITLVMLLRVGVVNRRLKTTQAALYEQQELLEDTVKERTDELLRTNHELQEDIAARVVTEKHLSTACDTLQGLYSIVIRNDLTRDQRLQSILDLTRQFLGVRSAVVSQELDGKELSVIGRSPEVQSGSSLLDPKLAAEAYAENRLLFLQTTDDWVTYIACPVTMSNRSISVFEFATPRARAQGSKEEFLTQVTEIQLRILRLIAYWISNERAMGDLESQDREQMQKLQQRFMSVSPREHEVLSHLVAGESNKDIARILNISTKTVELHRSNLLKKTEAKSSLELVSMAVQAGVFQPTP